MTDHFQKAPRFSVIIPVYREAGRINDTLEHLLGLPGQADTEILAVDGELEGRTLAAIRTPGVRKIASPKGRGTQLNAGAREATGEILFFLHADTRLPPNALNAIGQTLQSGDYVAGAFDLGIDSHRLAFRVIEKIACWRSRLTRIPYGDQTIFIRRDYFRSMGGFQDIPIMEDVDLMRRIKKKGGKIHILRDRVKTSARRWEKEGILYGTLRNWLLVSLFCSGVKPERLARFYAPNTKLLNQD
jgi:rSAM/selenodomain-associated transferase 2